GSSTGESVSRSTTQSSSRCCGCRSARSKRLSTASTLSKQCTASRLTNACYATISLTGSEGAVSRKARDARRPVRPPADAEALLSPEQVARRCGLSRRAVYRAIERGELRASRLCSRIRIRAADVEAWVDEHEIEPS